MKLIFVLAAAAMGVLSLVSPETVWRINESWRTRGGEGPSAFYTGITRLGGVLCIGLAIWALLFFQ